MRDRRPESEDRHLSVLYTEGAVSRAGLSIASALLFIGCQRTPAHDSAAAVVTFNKDVAPIVYANCSSCHRPADAASAARTPDGDPLCIAGAPFPLLDYDDVRRRAKQVATAVQSRRMPPWLPEPGHGEFAGERRLTDRQIATIQKWVEQGAPEGLAADRPAPPTWTDGWQLGRPDVIVTLPAAYKVPAANADIFRNFVLPVPAGDTRYVRAVEFRPGNDRILHHASVGVDPLRVSRVLDRADAEPGFAAMPDDRVQSVYGWTPGKAPFMEPAERAWTLQQGSDLVVQMHLMPRAQSEAIQPSIGLFLSDRPPSHEPIPIRLESKSIDIPAGQPDYAIEDSYVLPADVDVLSIYPHAHYLAKEFTGTATLPDGSMRSLLWIKAWDFRWQDQYRFVTPVALPAGTRLNMRITYDNSAANPRNPNRPPQRVGWGPRSSDEMGALWLDVVPRRQDDVAVLMRDYERRGVMADIAGAETQVRNSPRDPRAHNYLATKYLQVGQVEAAGRHLEEALRLDAGDAEAHSNLAVVLQAEGRLSDAVAHAREAVRLKPNDDRVQFNYGNVMNAAGATADAERALRRAASINPDNADAHFNLALLLASRNRLDEAIAGFRRAIEIAPGNPETHRNLAFALGMQGKFDQGIAEAQAALRLRPGFAEAQQILDSLQRAKAAAAPR